MSSRFLGVPMQSFRPNPSLDDHCQALIDGGWDRGADRKPLQIDVGRRFEPDRSRWRLVTPETKERVSPRPPGVQPDEEILEREIFVCVLYRDDATRELSKFSGKRRLRVWVALAEQIMRDG